MFPGSFFGRPVNQPRTGATYVLFNASAAAQAAADNRFYRFSENIPKYGMAS
jgi:hypothetical protein